jgi:hypothetical protein
MENERDQEDERLAGELVGDQLTAVIGELIAITYEMFPVESAGRKAALIAVLDIHQRLRAASNRPRLN